LKDILTEALIEMHFHSALIDYFTTRHGMRQLKLIKPSQYKEAWVGFDQAWVSTTISTSELYNNIRNAIGHNERKVNKLYIGYFLQFKCVDLLNRRSKYTPTTYQLPYYRSELDLNPNKHTGLSQHETLSILSNIENSSVYYACGMLFDILDIYSKPDMEKLRLISVKEAPSTILRNERHFITFQQPDLEPHWCSDPVEGKAYSFENWASGNLEDSPRLLKPGEVIAYLETMKYTLSNASKEGKAKLLEEEKKRRELLEQQRRQKHNINIKHINDDPYSYGLVSDSLPPLHIEYKQPQKEINPIPGSFNLIEFSVE
jgi:hypothetical protein